MGGAPLDLARYEAQAGWRIAVVRAAEMDAQLLSGAAGVEATARDTALAPATWRGEFTLNAGRLAFGENSLRTARANARFEGREAEGAAEWTLTAQRLDTAALSSERPSAAGEIAIDLSGDEEANGVARISLAGSRLTASAQDDIRAAFPDIINAPVGPAFAQAEQALDAAADNFDVVGPLALHVSEAGTRISIAAPIEARAATGMRLTLAPLREDAPALLLQWPGPALHGAISLELQGGGAPRASLLLDTVDWRPDAPFEADGTLTLTDWRAANSSIAAQELGVHFSQRNNAGQLDLVGPARITGPLGDGEVRDLVADLDVAIVWGNGWRVTPNKPCLPVRLAGMDVAGLSFQGGAFGLCAGQGGALVAADAARRLSGGFTIQRLALNGRMSGPNGQRARVSSTRVVGRFSGTTEDTRLAIEAAAPALAVDMDDARTIMIQGSRLTADTRVHDGTWRVDGAFDSGELNDPSLPGAVTAISGRWSAAPEDDIAVIRVAAGEAFVSAREAPVDATDKRPIFNAVRLRDIEAVSRQGRITAQGRILLDDPSQLLARFTAEHDAESGIGAAHIIADRIEFGPQLQPFQITELARGVIENVRGPASGTADINWTGDTLTAMGLARLEGVSLAMSTIPVIENVQGEVRFDNLFELTTPPGQQITVGLINPGISVRNGRLQFQLLSDQRVSIERAEFDFASGVLAMRPTQITLGSESTAFELTLSNVDVGALLSELNIPDLQATGQVEGTFPLVLTPRSAVVTNGVLRAQAGGGHISYTGRAGESATGAAKVAFDALRDFNYENLELVLNGDLGGDVVGSIVFRGENTGRPIDLTPIADLPGVGRVTSSGVPFAFNVSVTAPFRRLADAAATITDPTALINRAREEAARENEENEQPPPPVDPEPPSPR